MNHDDILAAPGSPDPALPMLTVEQAARLRALAAPQVRSSHGYSLHNLAQLCAQAPEDRWPDLVEAHFAALRAASPGGESAEELLRGVHARLLPTDALTPELVTSLRYARVVAEGLVLAYALDTPASVRILTDTDVERVEIGELGRAAYENLLKVPAQHDEVPLDEGALLHSVYGDSPFVASKALFLSELARQVTGEPLPDTGALVVVPTRHLVAYHPIADGSVAEALNALASYALGAHEDGPGALSPRVYWWHRGGLTSLTVIDHDTRTFSLQPPPELLGLMKGLVRLDSAGRLATSSAAKAPAPAELARTAAEAIAGLADDPAGLGDAFATALALAHARCVDDPDVAQIDTWDAWATAVQLGTALFTGAQAQECHLGEDLVRPLPTLPAAPPADARAWLDAFYLAVSCRQQERADLLCRVPLELLGRDGTVDPYVLHWIDTLRSYWSRRPMDEVVDKLIATINASQPETVAHAPRDFVNRIDYQPVALFHRLIQRNHEAFAETLAEAVAEHRAFWGDSAAPRARVALGPLAMACLAYDGEFPLPPKQPHLPWHLVNRDRIETIPG
ncbi:immunity 49 family protein [Streptomyces sp. H39-S7]|uniref:immunity 49 family protein n=1 Tax=Streptomyces sp. H39-S7 TaxID=3004357 RepID=UPI0022AE6F2A|nr:immunity 49 family protein [Streptomyces sp. H39-S7]MCZ4120958.1 immunity 49 family protein [Streptomyces sp. H39-S7]